MTHTTHNIVPLTPPAVVATVKQATISPLYYAPVRVATDHLPLLDLDTLPKNIFWEVLGRAVTLRRDYESATEAAFAAWLSNRTEATLIDAAGNIHVDTRTEPTHRSMFTAHTDTVHHGGGVNKVRVDGKFWRADTGHALGADDGSGCAVLAYMIAQGVPGYYVFFRGEERGGVGSKWLAENMPELFADIDRAVAFDRAGYSDVITHQAGGRCCSDEFADALAEKLSTDTDWYAPCNGGVYTDTAEFTGLIPECTNLSVGYKNQHGDREEQDVEFLWSLAKAAVSIDWDTLPTKRDPKAREARFSIGKYGTRNYQWWDDDEMDSLDPVGKKADDKTSSYKPEYALRGEAVLEDGDPESCVIDAIEAFRTGDKLWLMDLIAEAVYPEEPGMALRLMDHKQLSEDELSMAEDMIYEGWSATAALAELYEYAATV